MNNRDPNAKRNPENHSGNHEGVGRRELLLSGGALFAASAFAGGSLVTASSMPSGAQVVTGQPKPATAATKAANRAMEQYLNFNDREDFDNATRGLIGKPDTLTIKGEKGNVVWDLEE